MFRVEELSLELTNKCPLACIHCSSGSSPQELPGELTWEKHLELVRDARELGATVLSLSGGTPLEYNPPGKLCDIVALADRIGYESILLYTTGHSSYGHCISTYPYVEELVSGGLVTWIFSLHSHVDDVNDYIMRREGASTEIKESIMFLTRQNQRVELHMVPMRPNFRDIPGVRDMCVGLGISKLSLLRFVPQTRGKENVDKLELSRAQFVEMQLIMHNELIREHPVELRVGCPIDFRHAIGLLGEKAKPCHAGEDLILVRPQGNVHPCAAWKSLPADSNVNDTPLRDIWENSRVFNVIRAFKTGRTFYGGHANDIEDGMGYRNAPGFARVMGTCASCNLLNSCMTGCLAQRLHAYDGHLLDVLYDPYGDPLCPRGHPHG